MHQRSNIDRAPLGFGVALIALGTLMTLSRLDLLAVSSLAPWWPLALFAVGGGVAALGERPKALRTGVWLSLVGCWLLVNTLQLAGFRWWTSWPLMVMLAGAFQLFWPDEGEERGGGFMTLAIGTWLLATTQGWFGLGWRDSWPILLVLAGIATLLKALTQARAAARRRS
jgi:hypothetical protein